MPFECVLLPEPKKEPSFGNGDENIADKASVNNSGDVASKTNVRKKYGKSCCVHGCSSKNNVTSTSFHKLPTDNKLLKLWKIKCRLADKTPSSYVVCSKHFVDSDYSGAAYCDIYQRNRRLLRTAVPSQNLPTSSYARWKDVIQMESRTQRLLNRNSKQATIGPNVNVQSEELSNVTKSDIKLLPNNITNNSKSTNAKSPKKIATNNSLRKTVRTIAKGNPVKTENVSCSSITNTTSSSSTPRVNVIDFLNLKSRTKLMAWTGIQTFSLLTKIEERITSMHPKVLVAGSDLSLLECILLCFIKLKTKLSIICLTSIFHISSASVAQIFQIILPYIRRALDDVDHFSSTIESKDNKRIRLRMYGYNEARAIVDCTDVDVQNSKCSSKTKIEHTTPLESKDPLLETKPTLTDLCTPKLEYESSS